MHWKAESDFSNKKLIDVDNDSVLQANDQLRLQTQAQMFLKKSDSEFIPFSPT